MSRPSIPLAALMLFAWGCGKDKPATSDSTDDSKAVNVDAYKKRQQAYADSVLRSVPSARKVAEKLGNKYEVATPALRDTVAALARDPKTGCIEQGRKANPYLAGMVSIWVNISPAGSDVIRVQESKWSSDAGKGVDECLNTAAKAWKLSTAFAKPGAYIVQVEFR